MNTETIQIYYHSKEIEKLTYIDGKSDWIDLRAAEDVVVHDNFSAKREAPGIPTPDMKIPVGRKDP